MSLQQHFFFASCPREMEELLSKELNDIGISKQKVRRGGVQFEGSYEDGIKAVLYSRLASRIFLEVGFFNFFNLNDLYKQANKKIDWLTIFKVYQSFKISTLFDSGAKTFFRNSIVVSQKLKDAIVDQFRDKLGKRPSVNTDLPDVSFLLRVEEMKGRKGFKGMVYLDMCGAPLSNRGYRQPGHQAPIRENLAAALVMSSDFNPNEDIFVDPFCGSGTILIEAIMVGANIPSSLLKVKEVLIRREKAFNFQNHMWFRKNDRLKDYFYNACRDILEKGEAAIEDLQHNQYYGYDISHNALKLVKIHMAALKIDPRVITLKKADATKIEAPEEAPGVIITNPPYGKRLGEDDDLEELYHEFGENLKNNFKGYRAYIFTSEPSLRKKISLQTSQRIPFQNGDLECRLLRYELF